MASLRSMPSATSGGRPARPARLSDSGAAAVGGAPATTRVISPRTVAGAGPVGELGQGAPPDLLVRLGQLAAHARPPGPARTRRRSRPGWRPAGAGPRRTPGCAPRRPARPAASAARRARRGRNPSKQNRSHGSPDSASAVVTADGPGRRGDRYAGLDRRPDQPESGVGDARHATVGDHRDPGPVRARPRPARAYGGPRCPRSRTRPGRLVLTPRSRASRCRRRVSSAAIDVGPAEFLAQPGGGVGRVAERGAEQHDPASRSRGSDCCGRSATTVAAYDRGVSVGVSTCGRATTICVGRRLAPAGRVQAPAGPSRSSRAGGRPAPAGVGAGVGLAVLGGGRRG